MRVKATTLGSAALALATAATTAMPASTASTASTGPDAAAAPTDVIVHLFQWPWDSVAEECATVLGPKGFRAVQVSPPQEHVVLGDAGYPWWQDYQPVSYQLESRRGSRADFAQMVRTCHDAGVLIYVDAIVNHMAGGASTGPGSGGSEYTQYDYPAVPYGYDDFHHCGRNGNDDIVDWTDPWEVRNCELLDLSDLATESGHVRDQLAAYLNDLISLGVDGFRVDAAKHVPVDDLAAVYDSLTGDPYIYQEVVEGGGEIPPTDYAGIGDVTEFRYGEVVSEAFRDGHLATLNTVTDRMLQASDDAIAFIDNHDTQRSDDTILDSGDGAPYALAEAFLLTWPYGHAKVMSSFGYTDFDQGPPAAADGTTDQVDCADAGWVCEHRWPTTANLVELRNLAWGTDVTNWWTNGSDQIAFGRGSVGYVVFNRGGAALERTFQTSLPGGEYCDVANGDMTGSGCTAATYQVNSSGQFTATVPPDGLLALHTGAPA